MFQIDIASLDAGPTLGKIDSDCPDHSGKALSWVTISCRPPTRCTEKMASNKVPISCYRELQQIGIDHTHKPEKVQVIKAMPSTAAMVHPW